MPKKIIFVRHGQTSDNLTGRFMGWENDVSLNDQGKLEATRVGQHLAQYHIGAHFTSDLRRAQETAEIICQIIQVNPIALHDLRERDLGIFTGRMRDEVRKEWPDHLDKFIQNDDLDWNGFGGESLRDVLQRFDKLLHSLKDNHSDKTILIVSHAGYIYTILRDYFGYFPSGSYTEIAHTGVTVLDEKNGKYDLSLFNKVV